MKYGYVGLGHLGANLAMNLVKAGYEVTVTDLNKDNAKKLIAAGDFICKVLGRPTLSRAARALAAKLQAA